MSPLVEAAMIGVGGSVIVAVVAFLTTRAITGRQIAAARDQRILDRELAAYEAALTELMRMQIARLNALDELKKPEPDMMAGYVALR